MSALDVQIGGSHYKNMPIQPVEFIHKNGLGFITGNVIKYVCRADKKGGLEDLKKARHYIDLLIEMAGAAPKPGSETGEPKAREDADDLDASVEALVGALQDAFGPGVLRMIRL